MMKHLVLNLSIALSTSGCFSETVQLNGSADGLGEAIEQSVPVSMGVVVQTKAYLQGPYNSASFLMDDGLRAANLIPMVQPYSGVPGQSTTQSVLAVTGSSAAVDWIVVELRKPEAPAIVFASKAGLLLRNGSIVEAGGGVGDVKFENVPPGNYFVSLRHRNHFGVMSLEPVALSKVSNLVDFTNMGVATYGGATARVFVNGSPCLWAGDVNQNKTISQVGAGNDRDPILSRIGGVVPTNVVNGYYPEDINMNGSVSYAGAGNDRDVITLNIGGLLTGSLVSSVP